MRFQGENQPRSQGIFPGWRVGRPASKLGRKPWERGWMETPFSNSSGVLCAGPEQSNSRKFCKLEFRYMTAMQVSALTKKCSYPGVHVLMK